MITIETIKECSTNLERLYGIAAVVSYLDYTLFNKIDDPLYTAIKGLRDDYLLKLLVIEGE